MIDTRQVTVSNRLVMYQHALIYMIVTQWCAAEYVPPNAHYYRHDILCTTHPIPINQ